MYDLDVIVIDEMCVEGCACPSMNVCPVNAITRNEEMPPEIDLKACIRCGKCIKFCAHCAIQFDEIDQ